MPAPPCQCTQGQRRSTFFRARAGTHTWGAFQARPSAGARNDRLGMALLPSGATTTPRRLSDRYYPSMSSDTAEEVLCRGCGVTFRTHQGMRSYCCDDCYLYARFARMGICAGCDMEPPFEQRISGGFDRDSWLEQHLECRKRILDEDGRGPSCRCSQCKQSIPPKGRSRIKPRKRSEYRKHQKHRETVLKRDSYMCGICGVPTDPTVRPSEAAYPVIDHISAWSISKDDSVENLRTAHRWCNEAIGDGSGGSAVELYVRNEGKRRFNPSP